MKKVTACALASLCLMAMAGQAFCSAKHFKATYDHFTQYSNTAAELFFKAEDQSERNLLGYLTATSALYADKALMMYHILDILENMRDKADKEYVGKTVSGLRMALTPSIPEEIKYLSELVDGRISSEVRAIGERIINEIRVFERNVGNL